MKRMLFFIAVALLSLAIPQTNAWLDCAPEACPQGFTDTGIVCIGSACYRQCSGFACDNFSWNLSHNDYRESIWDHDVNYDSVTFNSYIPPSSDQCYRFEYSPRDQYSVTYTATIEGWDVCDVEGMAALVDNTNRDDPWYKNVQNGDDYDLNYLNITSPSSSYNHMLKLMRAHTDTDSNQDQLYAPDYTTPNYVYCAPSAMACDLLMNSSQLPENASPVNNCASGCVNRDTSLFVMNGHFKEKGDADINLYTDDRCAGKYGLGNRLQHTGYRVYTTPANIPITNDQVCERPNEAPRAKNVQILPQVPTAGHDLFCDYRFDDPEGFEEANSSYAWWKNNVDQNLNSQMLSRSYLNPGDSWFCRVTPHDGLQTGQPVQSNTVTIQTTVKDLRMDVEAVTVWQDSGYFAGPAYIDNFTEPINQSLESCTPDAEKECTLSMEFRSVTTGKLELSDLGLHYIIINQQPVLAVPDQYTSEDALKTINLSQYATDPDNDTLRFTVMQENLAELNCEVDAELLALIPAENWNGLGNEAASCTLGANDGIALVNQTFFINVTPVNDAPLLVIPDQSLDEDSSPVSINLQAYSSDIEGDTLEFSVVNENITAVDCATLGSTLTMTPAADWNGQTTCTVEVDDGNNKSQNLFQIIVLPINDPPVMSIPDQLIAEDSGNSTIDLMLYAEDIDGDVLTYRVMSYNRTELTCSIQNSIFSFQPMLNWNGQSTCTIEVDDTHGGIAQDTVMITVLPVNDAPVVYAIAPIQVTEGSIIDQPIYAFDIERDPLLYSVNDSRFMLNGTRLVFKTKEGDEANFTIQIAVDDNVNTTLQTIPITIQPFTGVIDTFYDGSGNKILTYPSPGYQDVYIRVKKDSFLVNGSLIIQGYD